MNTHTSEFFKRMIEDSKIRTENYRVARALKLIDCCEYNQWLEKLVDEELNNFNKELGQCGS